MLDDPILYENELEEARNIDWRLLLMSRSFLAPGPLETDCWIWAGSLTNGYGRVYLASPNNKGEIGKDYWDREPNGLHEVVYAHRLSWIAFNGSIPEGLSCLHKCDVKACIRPNHMYLGTQWDNVKDREARGLRPHGYRALPIWRRL
jgi:hypothetical protein